MTEEHDDILQSHVAGRLMIQGGYVRLVALASGILITTGASVVLLRFLGVADFGRFATGMAIIATAQGITDAGLTIVGTRELAATPPGQARRKLVAELFGLRLLLAPLLVLIATGFAVAAGYPRALIEGVLIGSVGAGLLAAPLSLSALLAVELRNTQAALLELIRQTAVAVTFVGLVAVRADLELFFAAQIVSALAMLAALPWLVGASWRTRPSRSPAAWRSLLARSLPVAISYAISLIYFRVMLIMLSLTADERQTGLFGTSLRVFELLLGVPTVVLGVALPLVTASLADRDRLRYQLQRLVEATLLGATLTAVAVSLAAGPIIEVIGGSDYSGVREILRIHIFAFVPVCLAALGQMTLIALGRQRDLIGINLVALVFMVIAAAIVIPRWEALGAAWTAIAAELLLAGMTYAALRRHAGAQAPRLVASWPLVPATALALAAGTIPIPDLASTGLGIGVFLAVAYASGRIPDELFDALPRRDRRERHG